MLCHCLGDAQYAYEFRVILTTWHMSIFAIAQPHCETQVATAFPCDLGSFAMKFAFAKF